MSFGFLQNKFLITLFTNYSKSLRTLEFFNLAKEDEGLELEEQLERSSR